MQLILARKTRDIFFSLSFSLVLFALLPGLVMALEVPQLQGRVNDYASLLQPSTVSLLDKTLTQIEQEDSTQIVLLTIESLRGDSLEDFSLREEEKWKLGQEKLDNGVLLLIAKNDRKIRIEVGYGLEGTLTDLMAGRIIRNSITPQFRKGNFDQGILDGIAAIVSVVRGQYNADEHGNKRRGNDLEGFLPMMFFFLFILGSMLRRSKILAAVVGGVALPFLALISGITGSILLVLVFFGALGGFVASLLAASSGGGRSGRIFSSRNGGFGGGFGGFSGGGGGFGGG